MIRKLKKRIEDFLRTLSRQPLTRIGSWKDDPKWILFGRLVMWGSVLSVLGMLVISTYVGLWYLPPYVSRSFLVVTAVLIFLATASGIPVFLYERKRMREWLVEELERFPRKQLLEIAQKEGVTVSEDLGKERIVQRLMDKLKRKVIEDYVFSEEDDARN